MRVIKKTASETLENGYRNRVSIRSVRTNTIGPSDLAWVIHGVVIAQGFFNLVKTKSLTGCVFLCLILIFALVDWHLFYKIYDRLNPYPLYLWVWDYLLLALLAASVSEAIRSDMGFFVVSCLWFFGTLV